MGTSFLLALQSTGFQRGACFVGHIQVGTPGETTTKMYLGGDIRNSTERWHGSQRTVQGKKWTVQKAEHGEEFRYERLPPLSTPNGTWSKLQLAARKLLDFTITASQMLPLIPWPVILSPCSIPAPNSHLWAELSALFPVTPSSTPPSAYLQPHHPWGTGSCLGNYWWVRFLKRRKCMYI